MTILGTPAAVLGLATLVLYVVAAPTWIVEGDNAELAGLGALGGAAHPTGYPLYVLWLRLWSWLPAHSPAHAAALATGLLTAIEAVLLYRAARAWGAREVPAVIAVALVITSPIVLRVQSQAEVFALNGLVAAAVVWLAALEEPLRGRGRVVALALVAGLGLSNHMTCVLIAPIGVLGVVRGVREEPERRVAVVALGVAAFAVGLAPYLYLLVAPDTACSWGKLSSLAAVVRHMLRMDYGGPGELSPHGTHVPALTNELALATTLGRAFVWVLPAVALVAWKRAGESRAGWLAWLASFVLAGPLFVARFNIAPVGLEHYTVSRFHLLPLVLLAVPVAVGLDWVGTRVLANIPGALVRSRRVGVALGIALLAASGVVSMRTVARYHSPAAQRSLENMLDTLPDRAIVIGTQDILHFGTNYLQGVVGERRDVTILTMPQIGLRYYRDRIRAKTGVDLSAQLDPKDPLPSVHVAELMLATGRPVFIDAFQANIAKSFPVYPYGAVFRVLPRGTPVPTIDELFATNKRVFERMRFDYPVPGPNDDLAAQAHVLYAATWRALAPHLTGDAQAYALAMIAALTPQ